MTKLPDNRLKRLIPAVGISTPSGEPLSAAEVELLAEAFGDGSPLVFPPRAAATVAGLRRKLGLDLDTRAEA